MLDCPLKLREPPRICKCVAAFPFPRTATFACDRQPCDQKQQMPKSTSVELQARFLSALLQEREVQPRASLLAHQIVEILPGAAAVVYLLQQDEHGGNVQWSPKAVAGDIHLDDAAIPMESGTLGHLARESQPLLLSGSTLVREDYAHLHARRTLLSLACVPMMINESLIGAVEVATFDEELDESEASGLVELVDYAAPAFSSATRYEAERNSRLESISRLTQLYDVEKVFNSTLEMDELNPIITAKVREILEAQAVNLWMVKDDQELLLMDRSGEDPTRPVGTAEKSGEGYIAEVSDSANLFSSTTLRTSDCSAATPVTTAQFSLYCRSRGCQGIPGWANRSHQQAGWDAVF